jgi:UDP-3-O-[3-hydroxymyristoyl] glucosamine N-acyltransferase
MSVQLREILENFPDLVKRIRGDAGTVVKDIQTGTTASSASLLFLSKAEQIKEAATCPAAAWITTDALLSEVPDSVPFVGISPNPYLAMALVAKRFFPQTRSHHAISSEEKIHPSAQISPSARLGRDCLVGPGVVIGDNCDIGDRCILGANTVLEPDVKLGDDTHIHPLVFIAHSCELGKRCEVHPQTSIGTEGFGYAQDAKFNHYRVTHYGRVIIEDDVHIGAGVQIDRGTFEDSRIGSGTKIDNHCHFGHNIRIGRNTLITGGMITAGSVTLGNNCVFGGRTTVKGHLTVADGSRFAGLSGIGNDVNEPGEYGGLPLQPVQAELRTRASLKRLPGLIKDVRRIMKHLGLA